MQKHVNHSLKFASVTFRKGNKLSWLRQHRALSLYSFSGHKYITTVHLASASSICRAVFLGSAHQSEWRDCGLYQRQSRYVLPPYRPQHLRRSAAKYARIAVDSRFAGRSQGSPWTQVLDLHMYARRILWKKRAPFLGFRRNHAVFAAETNKSGTRNWCNKSFWQISLFSPQGTDT